MKLASFHHEGRDRIGFAVKGGLADLNDCLASAGRPERYDTILALIEAGEAGRAALRVAATVDPPEVIAENAIRWQPPVRRPSKICGVAMNNSASDSRKVSAPTHPLFFLKPASSLTGHLEPIEVRDSFGSVHPEPELAVIIGKLARDVPEAEAMSHVYGYSILNDMTGNDMRAEDRVHYYALYPSKDDPNVLERREQHLSYTARYKGADTFGPMGPWLVTADDVPDPHALDVRCWHKEDLIAEDSTAFYTYSVSKIIAWISSFVSLWPGDVISMGTAFRPGVGQTRSLHTANVTALGGPLRVEISGLGVLENPVARR